jgi:hypothetical protein
MIVKTNYHPTYHRKRLHVPNTPTSQNNNECTRDVIRYPLKLFIYPFSTSLPSTHRRSTGTSDPTSRPCSKRKPSCHRPSYSHQQSCKRGHPIQRSHNPFPIQSTRLQDLKSANNRILPDPLPHTSLSDRPRTKYKNAPSPNLGQERKR